jgi:hypothetical protein
VGEHSGTVLGDVLVEQDAGLDIAQQPRQLGLTVEESAVAQILAIVLDKVDGVGSWSRRAYPPITRLTITVNFSAFLMA